MFLSAIRPLVEFRPDPEFPAGALVVILTVDRLVVDELEREVEGLLAFRARALHGVRFDLFIGRFETRFTARMVDE